MFYVQKQNKQANRKKSPNDRCKKKKKDRRQGHRGCVSEVKTGRLSHPDWPLLKNKQSARCWMSRLNQHHWLLRGGKQRESLDVAAETSQTQGRNMVCKHPCTHSHRGHYTRNALRHTLMLNIDPHAVKHHLPRFLAFGKLHFFWCLGCPACLCGVSLLYFFEKKTTYFTEIDSS